MDVPGREGGWEAFLGGILSLGVRIFFSDRSMLSRKRRTLGFSCSPPDSAVLLTVMIAMGFGWEKISFLFKVFISDFFLICNNVASDTCLMTVTHEK